MKKRKYLVIALLSAGCLFSPNILGNLKMSAEPPNIVFFMLDELGYFELSSMGNKKLKTPNIDRMALEGMRFTQALAGSPVCAPTRSTLMTGQHTGHTTVRRNAGDLALRREDITIAQVMKQAGYNTGGFGKWGLGDRGTTGVPELHGFDTFYGYYHQVHAHSYFPNYLIRNGRKIPLEGNTGDFYKGKQFAHHLIVEEAKRFIRDNKDGPFFCYCPWTPPHGLWGIPDNEPSWKLYKDKRWTAGQRTPQDAKVYAAMVHMVDRQIGEIVALLKEEKIDDNTIIFICGDNGGQPYFLNGDPSKPKPDSPPFPHGFFGPNLNPSTGEVFRGGKRELYEGGLRIPMIVWGPGKVSPGQVSDHLWYLPDVMPTLAELAQTKPPENVDGISIVPTLFGPEKTGRTQENHKYLYWEFENQIAVRIDNYKGVKSAPGAPFELYDLNKDIEEKNNVAEKFPQIIEQMSAYVRQAHTENITGQWIDKSKGFKGHREK
ncbi:arylsulfatase [Acidobacteriota bacterium]